MRTLISGGLSDIGRAITERRILLGDTIMVTSSRNNPEVNFSRSVETCFFDLASPEEGSDPLAGWIEKGVDCLVLNAFTKNKSLRKIHETDFDEIRESFEINVLGNIWLLQKCLSVMESQGFGRIVLISSIATQGAEKYGLYSSAKGALESLIKSISMDYGGSNICANTIRPGVIETSRTKRFWKRFSYVEVMRPLVPQERFGQPVDVAKSIDYFLSPDCYATGESLNISGGLPHVKSSSLFKVGL